MRIETAALVMAGVAVAAEAGKSVAEYEAANVKERALELQSKEIAVQTQQKTLSNFDVMEKVLDAQQAYMTISGTAFSSPSFNAIQRNTWNEGTKKHKNITLEGEISQENIAAEKENVRNTLYAQLFGNAADVAMNAASVAAKMPSSGGA